METTSHSVRVLMTANTGPCKGHASRNTITGISPRTSSCSATFYLPYIPDLYSPVVL